MSNFHNLVAGRKGVNEQRIRRRYTSPSETLEKVHCLQHTSGTDISSSASSGSRQSALR